MPRWPEAKRVRGVTDGYTIRRVKADLFTVHAPSYLDTHGRILGTARTMEEACEMFERVRVTQ